MRTLANATAERVVLGAMMLDADAVLEQCPNLTGDMFYRSQNGALFDLMVSMRQAGTPVDLLSVSDQVRTDENRYGSLRDVAGLCDDVPSTKVRHWMQKLVELHYSRKLQQRLYNSIDALENGAAVGEVQQLLDRAESEVQSADGFVHIGSIAPVAYQQSAERRTQSQQGRQVFLPMPCATMQREVLIPVREKYFVALGGRPSHGKTAVALDIGRAVAKSDVWDPVEGRWRKGHVGIVSLEMEKEKLVKRLATQESGINYVSYEKGDAVDNPNLSYMDAFEAIAHLNIWIDDRPARSVEEVCRSMRRHVRIHGPVDLWIIDYMEKFRFDANHSGGRPQAIADACGTINDTLKETRSACLALAQFKRALDDRAGHIPMLNDFAGSSGIEKEADLAWGVVRHCLYPGAELNGAKENEASFYKFKAREGTTGHFKTGFNGARFSYYDLETSRYEGVA